MLQITLESNGQVDSSKSFHKNNWDFKLRVIPHGDTTELRVSFDDNEDSTHSDYLNNYDEPEKLGSNEEYY